jgi:hypothetical protein
VEATIATVASEATAPVSQLSKFGFDQTVVAGASQATTVDLPWPSREALLRRLARQAGTDKIIGEFADAGLSRPVRLGSDDKARLLQECTSWLYEDADRLPEGIYALRNALLADQPQLSTHRPAGRARKKGSYSRRQLPPDSEARPGSVARESV